MRLPLRIDRRTIGGPAGNARTSWPRRESVFVFVGEEVVGVGEASPIPGHSRESVDDVWHELSARGPSIDLADLDGVSSAARFALATAELDRQGRLRMRPAWRVLRGASSSVPVAPLKLKLGPSDVADLPERLRIVRRNNPGIPIRLDFNRTLPIDVWRALDPLVASLVEFVEEPCVSFVPSLSRLAFDESLSDPDWRDRVRGNVVVLKPSVVGGVHRALALAHEAAALGADVVVSYGWEGIVGWTGAAALALALGPRRFADGLCPHDSLQVPATHLSDGRLQPWSTPGLGLEVS